MSICKLLNAVASLPTDSGLEPLRKAVHNSEVSLNDVNEWVAENLTTYNRQLVFQGCGFQALVLTWQPGQVSPIHDHVGSCCCLKVLQGNAIETAYEPQRSGVVTPNSTAHPVGTVLAGEDADVHRIENHPNAALPLITLHIYRPALLFMNKYEFKNGRLLQLSPTA